MSEEEKDQALEQEKKEILAQEKELDTSELDEVSGGLKADGNCFCLVGGGGNMDPSHGGKTCACVAGGAGMADDFATYARCVCAIAGEGGL